MKAGALSLGQAEVFGIVAAVAVAGLLLWKAGGAAAKAATAAAGAVGGALSGNNTLTASQTDASGAPVTAYQGAGVAGTAGAAVNTVTGGATASLGEMLGGWLYDSTHADPLAAPASTAPASTAPAVDASWWTFAGG